jgi:hypothetical protein
MIGLSLFLADKRIILMDVFAFFLVLEVLNLVSIWTWIPSPPHLKVHSWSKTFVLFVVVFLDHSVDTALVGQDAEDSLVVSWEGV